MIKRTYFLFLLWPQSIPSLQCLTSQMYLKYRLFKSSLLSLFKVNMIFVLLLVNLKCAFSDRSGHTVEISGWWSGWTWQWHNSSRARLRCKASLTAWRWKKWHWLNLIPERWHHSHRRGGCVRIGRRPRPIRAHTHGKSLKKIQKSVGKLSTASAAGPSTTATNTSNNNNFV